MKLKPETRIGWVAALAVAAAIVTNAETVWGVTAGFFGWVASEAEEPAEERAVTEALFDHEVRLQLGEQRDDAFVKWNIKNYADAQEEVEKRNAADALYERVQRGDLVLETIE